MTANLKRNSGFALKEPVTVGGSTTEFVEGGGLISYDADLADGYRRVASLRRQNP